jgi:hypothetical protein
MWRLLQRSAVTVLAITTVIALFASADPSRTSGPVPVPDSEVQGLYGGNCGVSFSNTNCENLAAGCPRRDGISADYAGDWRLTNEVTCNSELSAACSSVHTNYVDCTITQREAPKDINPRWATLTATTSAFAVVGVKRR